MIARPLLVSQIRRFLGAGLMVAALVSQILLLWLAGELLDLFIGAVELWAELARKHLELTL